MIDFGWSDAENETDFRFKLLEVLNQICIALEEGNRKK